MHVVRETDNPEHPPAEEVSGGTAEEHSTGTHGTTAGMTEQTREGPNKLRGPHTVSKLEGLAPASLTSATPPSGNVTNGGTEGDGVMDQTAGKVTTSPYVHSLGGGGGNYDSGPV